MTINFIVCDEATFQAAIIASDVIETFFQDQDLNFKTKTLQYFQDQA